MRKLLNTLFVTSEDAYLALENENVIVLAGEERKGQFPLIVLEGVITFSYKGASPALMGACARNGVGLCFIQWPLSGADMRCGAWQCASAQAAIPDF